MGKGWSSVLPTSGDTSKWRKKALAKHDVTDLGGPLSPEIDSPLQMGNILQPTFAKEYFSDLGYGIIFPFDSKQYGEMAGEIKAI